MNWVPTAGALCSLSCNGKGAKNPRRTNFIQSCWILASDASLFQVSCSFISWVTLLYYIHLTTTLGRPDLVTQLYLTPSQLQGDKICKFNKTRSAVLSSSLQFQKDRIWYCSFNSVHCNFRDIWFVVVTSSYPTASLGR